MTNRTENARIYAYADRTTSIITPSRRSLLRITTFWALCDAYASCDDSVAMYARTTALNNAVAEGIVFG